MNSMRSAKRRQRKHRRSRRARANAQRPARGDGRLNSNSGVIVMAATNRPETLMPHCCGRGRFDRHVLVDRADVSGRVTSSKFIWKYQSDSDVDVKALAAITSGSWGPIWRTWSMRRAVAARKGRRWSRWPDSHEAVERPARGSKRKAVSAGGREAAGGIPTKPATPRCVVAAEHRSVHKVSIIPRGLAALGYTMQRPSRTGPDDAKRTESRIQVSWVAPWPGK